MVTIGRPPIIYQAFAFLLIFARVWGLSLGPCLQSKSKSLNKAEAFGLALYIKPFTSPLHVVYYFFNF